MSLVSKSKIDKAGLILGDQGRAYDETTLEMEYLFEDYRKRHLGSGLIAHSQKITVAARAMAERKAIGHRS